ncbi:hypothetical protein ERO13_A05G293750v2 [Gossypium hirsutum]|nr:hypothetical protein ERO13_A05G293750v2 [Gossypium hirsutum]
MSEYLARIKHLSDSLAGCSQRVPDEEQKFRLSVKRQPSFSISTNESLILITKIIAFSCHLSSSPFPPPSPPPSHPPLTPNSPLQIPLHPLIFPLPDPHRPPSSLHRRHLSALSLAPVSPLAPTDSLDTHKINANQPDIPNI